ncbi:MAG: PP2C family protein-serine/threonine phosphatase [Armatimonadota bacterium]
MARSTPQHIPAARATSPSLQQESVLVVAIFRTALIILAVLSPLLRESAHTPRLQMQLSILFATVYNIIVVILYWRRIRLPGQREVMIIIDVLLVTWWVFLTWSTGPVMVGSPLFPLYFVVVIVSALWFGVTGALTTACFISILYVLGLFQISGYDPFVLIDALFRQVIYVFLVALVAGYLADIHQREREQWTRSQVLLAQYQERFRAAQEVYELLIPQHPPQVAGLELAARWRPALQEGGGDFYDVIPLDSGRVAITIADVSGKHTRGALKLPLFKAAFLASAQVWEDPGKVLAQVNRIVYPLLQPDMFITACVLVVDLEHHRLWYANAGQDPPVFVRERTRDTVLLSTGGLVLGVDANADYPTEEQHLEPGDTLCLYTDGITEARNPETEEFGYQNLEARVQAGVALGLPAEGIAENIFDAVNQYARGEARHDDMTVVVMRYRPNERDSTVV